MISILLDVLPSFLSNGRKQRRSAQHDFCQWPIHKVKCNVPKRDVPQMGRIFAQSMQFGQEKHAAITESGANFVAPFSGLYSRFPSSSQMSHTRGLTLPSSSSSSETGCDVNTQQLFSSSLSLSLSGVCRSSSNTLFEGKVAEEEEKRREKQRKKERGPTRETKPPLLFPTMIL